MNKTVARPIWLSLQEAVELWDLAITESGKAPEASEMNRAFGEALASGRFTALGVCLDGKTGADNAPLIPIPPHHFRLPRSFRFGRVESWSDSTSIDQFRQARALPARHPDWEEVVFNSKEFLAWLNEASGRAAKRGKPGAKPKVNTQAFEKEVHRWIAENGMPNPDIDPESRQSDLERHMTDWHGGKIGESQNRVHVTSAIKSYQIK
jgi:hypothetical protein